MFNTDLRGGDLTQLPVVWRDGGHPVTGLFCLIIAVGILAVFGYAGLQMHRRFEFEPVFLLGILIPILLLWLVLSQAARFFERRRIRIAEGRVQVELIRLGRTRRWQEQVSSYRGVLYRTVTRTRGSGQSARAYAVFQLALLHAETGKSILLYEALQEAGMRQRWEDTARAFGHPALEAGAGAEILERKQDELDKSIVDQIREGQLAATASVTGRTPDAFRLVEKENVFEVHVVRSRVKPAAVVAMLAFAGVFIWIGFFGDAPVAFGWGGILFVVVTILTVVLNLVTKPKIILTDGVLELVEEHPFGRFVVGSFPVAELETIRKGRLPTESGEGLVFSSDTASAQFATGNSDEALEWLRQRLLQQIDQ